MSKADYKAFWRAFQLGDFVKEPPRVDLIAEAPQITPSAQAERAALAQKAPGIRYRVELRAAYQRLSSNPAAFWKTKVQALTELASVMGYGAGYILTGPFAFVLDGRAATDGGHVSAITGAAAAGASVAHPIVADAGIVEGDLVFVSAALGTGSVTAELARAEAGTSSSQVVLSLTKSYAAFPDNFIAKAAFGLPECQLVSGLSFAAEGNANELVEREVRFALEGVDDPMATNV